MPAMKTIYVESTVVSYFTAEPTRDIILTGRQQATRELWVRLGSEFSTYVSALVLQEAGRGDAEQARRRLQAIARFPALDIDDMARTLAERILVAKAIPAEYPEDALHIAVAAVNGFQVVLTWNFAHLNNPFTRMLIREAVENAGYHCPEICSPEELLESQP
jgi:predicted nucleic acid-binding protein